MTGRQNAGDSRQEKVHKNLFSQPRDRDFSCTFFRLLRAPEGCVAIFSETSRLLRFTRNFDRWGKVFVSFVLFTVCCLLPTFSDADTVHSRAAVVMDTSTGKLLYAKNPDLRCPPASTTKLMTAILSIENLPLAHVVMVSKNASQVSPHKAGFKEGDRVTVEELLYAALLGSANDAAVALAEAVAGTEERFVDLMNKKACMIGARDTHFINANGLPGPGQYITAADLSKIMNYALNYPKLKQIINTRVTEISTEKGRSIFLRNTNRLLWSEEGLVGGKTGYTRTARHCFVCAAERENDTVVVALLGSPSRSDLWRESGLLIGKGFDILSSGEEPVIYLAKADDVPVLEKASQKKKSHLITKKRSKSKKGKTFISKKSGAKKKTMLVKKKGNRKILAKYKAKKKNYRVAKKDGITRNKG